MKGRGFTVIETVMASALGAILVLVAMGVFTVIDRTERATDKRARDAATLAQLHMVMDRTFSSLIMSEGMLAGGPRPPARDKGEAMLGGPEFDQKQHEEARPRMLLETDERFAQRAREGSVQRLEVVLTKPPIPPGFGTALLMDTSYMAEDDQIRAARGVFELRPGRPHADTSRQAARGTVDDGTWTLWWRALPPTSGGKGAAAYMIDPREDGRAAVVAEGLTECKWTAFKERQRGPSIVAGQFTELPAYMEMEVRTVSGLQVNWMFEVQWTVGPETQQEADDAAAAGALLGAAGGAAGGTGATGGAVVAAGGTTVAVSANGTTTTLSNNQVSKPVVISPAGGMSAAKQPFGGGDAAANGTRGKR